MPWVEPTLQELRNQFKSDFLTRSDTGDAVLRRSVENVLSFTVPGIANGLHGYIGWGIRQVVPSEDADLDSILRWANDFLEVPQIPAIAAIGDVTFTGVDTTIIPQGTEVTSRDGATFTTDAQYVISGTTITDQVTAVVAGAAGNTLEGSAVFLGSPIAGIESEAIVAVGGISGGADEEDKFGVLERLRQRFRRPPRGGSAGDYVAWALEVAAITRAFEYPQDPTVGWVKVVAVDDVSGPVPGAAALLATQTNLDEKRPIAMGGVLVIGPTPQLLELQWTSLVSGDVAAAKIALEANVESWVLSTGEPGLSLSHAEIENAAQAATGVQSVTLADPVIDVYPGTYGMFTTFNHTYI